MGWERCAEFAWGGLDKYSLQTCKEPQKKLIAHFHTPRPLPTLFPSLNSLLPPLILSDSSSTSLAPRGFPRKPSEPHTELVGLCVSFT